METRGLYTVVIRYCLLLALTLTGTAVAQEAVEPELLTPVQQRMKQECR